MKSYQPKPFYKRPLVIAATMLVVLLVVGALLELTNTTHIFHEADSNKTPLTAGQSTKGEGTATNQGNSNKDDNQQAGNSSTSQPGDDKNTPTSGADLIAPSGTFVSAHRNVPTSANLSSVCNTTTGATCQITFTSGATIKSLPVQTTDRGGATFWNSWTPASIGLTSGTWQVQAVATLNGQTKTSTDALTLEIQ